MYGDKGKKWLADLPALLSCCEGHLEIKLEPCYPELSYHYVAPALLSNGKKAVLKCGVPNQGLEKEAMALRHFNGNGCVKLLDSDQEVGVLLLEKADPGEILEKVKDEQQACIIAVNVMHQLHKPVNDTNHFDTLQNWFAGLDDFYQQMHGKTDDLSILSLIDKAQKISHDLLASMNSKVLLHGDLHYANILSSHEHGWIAIDPKGVIGEPEYEIPLPRLGKEINKKTIERHIDRFIEISGFDRQRILDWLLVKAVLAAWWSFEDHGEIWKPFIECAEMVSNIRVAR